MKTVVTNLIRVLVVGVCCTGLYAQQEPNYSQYMYNTMTINPAYVGSTDNFNITANYKAQFTGIDGAPETVNPGLETPVTYNVGLGLNITRDALGPSEDLNVDGNFSYSIQLSSQTYLSFGLKAGFRLLNVDFRKGMFNNPNDPAFMNNIDNKFLGVLGAGTYLFSDKWYLGLSTPKLLENNFGNNTSTGSNNIASEQRHYFLIAGSVFNLNSRKSLKFKPTTFVKVTNGAPIEADLTGVFIIQDQVEIGGMYRTGDAAGILLGYNFTNQLRFGYSFDWSFTNTTGKYNSGSHEVMLRYDFIYKGKFKIRSPRYF